MSMFCILTNVEMKRLNIQSLEQGKKHYFNVEEDT